MRHYVKPRSPPQTVSESLRPRFRRKPDYTVRQVAMERCTFRAEALVPGTQCREFYFATPENLHESFDTVKSTYYIFLTSSDFPAYRKPSAFETNTSDVKIKSSGIGQMNFLDVHVISS